MTHLPAWYTRLVPARRRARHVHDMEHDLSCWCGWVHPDELADRLAYTLEETP